MDLWSIAVYDLHLDSAAFYALTPRQFSALVKRKELEQQTKEFLFGQLCAVAANFSMCRPKKPVEPRDFMPSQWGKIKRKRRYPSKKKLASKLSRLFGVSTANGNVIHNRLSSPGSEAKIPDGAEARADYARSIASGRDSLPDGSAGSSPRKNGWINL